MAVTQDVLSVLGSNPCPIDDRVPMAILNYVTHRWSEQRPNECLE